MMQSRPDHSFVPGLADDRLTRPAVTGDMAVASLFGQLGDLLARMPGAWGRTGRRGTRLVMTGTPGETFNGIFSSASVPDVEEVAELAGCLIGRDERWSIFSRTEPVTELLELAAKHGLTHQTRQPVMVRGTEPVRAEPGEPDSPIVRRVADTDIEAYLDVLASVTGNPRKPQSDQMFVDLFAIPETKGYLLEHHGEPAAIGLGHTSAGLVGLYNIATRPELRNRGYGRLISEAVLRDAFGNGATGAYLRSSDMGQSLYRSIGFETIETWTWLTRPSA